MFVSDFKLYLVMSGLVNIITLRPSTGETTARPEVGATVPPHQYLDVSRALMSLRPEKQIQSEKSKATVPGNRATGLKPHSQVHLLSSVEKCKVENLTIFLVCLLKHSWYNSVLRAVYLYTHSTQSIYNYVKDPIDFDVPIGEGQWSVGRAFHLWEGEYCSQCTAVIFRPNTGTINVPAVQVVWLGAACLVLQYCSSNLNGPRTGVHCTFHWDVSQTTFIHYKSPTIAAARLSSAV